jgi:hypothetical protein
VGCWGYNIGRCVAGIPDRHVGSWGCRTGRWVAGDTGPVAGLLGNVGIQDKKWVASGIGYTARDTGQECDLS